MQTDSYDAMEVAEIDDSGNWSHSKVQHLLTLYLDNKEKFRNPKVKK